MYRLSVLFSNVFFLQFVIKKLCYALRAEILEEDFFSLEGVAHRRCALSIRGRQIGELALIDGWH